MLLTKLCNKNKLAETYQVGMHEKNNKKQKKTRSKKKQLQKKTFFDITSEDPGKKHCFDHLAFIEKDYVSLITGFIKPSTAVQLQ